MLTLFTLSIMHGRRYAKIASIDPSFNVLK